MAANGKNRTWANLIGGPRLWSPGKTGDQNLITSSASQTVLLGTWGLGTDFKCQSIMGQLAGLWTVLVYLDAFKNSIVQFFSSRFGVILQLFLMKSLSK